MTETVVIGCKLPHGLKIEVGIDKNGNASEGYRTVTLEGPAKNVIIGNPYGFTTVDKSLWEEWMKTHKDAKYIREKLVFVQSDLPRAQAQGMELAKQRTGLESIQEKDPRLDKRTRELVTQDNMVRSAAGAVRVPG
jgi:hypothetical protein